MERLSAACRVAHAEMAEVGAYWTGRARNNVPTGWRWAPPSGAHFLDAAAEHGITLVRLQGRRDPVVPAWLGMVIWMTYTGAASDKEVLAAIRAGAFCAGGPTVYALGGDEALEVWLRAVLRGRKCGAP